MQDKIAIAREFLTKALADSNRRRWSLKDVLLELAARVSAKDLIEGLIADQRYCEESAKMSYRHRNNFDKIVLLASQIPAYKLRLHLWWPEEGTPYREHVHNHRWNFASLVAAGGYRFESFVENGEGQALHSYRYWSPESNEFYRMEPLGTVKVARALDLDLVSGVVYELANSVLHRVTASPALGTLTLVLQGPVSKEWTTVLSEEIIERPAVLPAARLSREALVERLERAGSLLG